MARRPLNKFDDTIDIAEKEGQVTEGTFLGYKEVNFGTDNEGKPDNRYVVQMRGQDGEVFSFWASTSIRQQLPQIPGGAYLWITYKGMEKNPKTRRIFKAFDIDIDDAVPSVIGPKAS